MFDHDRSSPAFADMVRLQMQPPSKARQKRDKSATTQLPAGKAPNSRNESIPAPTTLAKVRDIEAVIAKGERRDNGNNATRQPVGEEKKEKKENEQNQEIHTHTAVIPVQEHKENILAIKSTPKTRRKLEAARAYVEKNRTDKGNKTGQDDLLNAEYGDEIFEDMCLLEKKMKPNASSMETQKVNWSMRTRVVSWLVEVRMDLDLLPEALFLAVNYLDRLLSVQSIAADRLQLAGLTALFIAAKYECRRQTGTQEIVDYAVRIFTADSLFQAECFMLTKLDFNLGYPDSMSFLGRMNQADGNDEDTCTVAKYFLHITILDKQFVGCTSSSLSAAAYCLARFMRGKKYWVFI
jgi:G2/mitotic-specific cyclin 3/4